MATYTTEIMPYGLRAKGFTWLNFCVTLSLFFSMLAIFSFVTESH